MGKLHHNCKSRTTCINFRSVMTQRKDVISHKAPVPFSVLPWRNGDRPFTLKCLPGSLFPANIRIPFLPKNCHRGSGYARSAYSRYSYPRPTCVAQEPGSIKGLVFLSPIRTTFLFLFCFQPTRMFCSYSRNPCHIRCYFKTQICQFILLLLCH